MLMESTCQKKFTRLTRSGPPHPVCSLLSQVNEMAYEMDYDPDFRAIPGSEKMIYIPENVVNSMSTDSQMCYKLVATVKRGHLPNAMQEMHCGPLCHAR